MERDLGVDLDINKIKLQVRKRGVNWTDVEEQEIWMDG